MTDKVALKARAILAWGERGPRRALLAGAGSPRTTRPNIPCGLNARAKITKKTILFRQSLYSLFVDTA